MNKKILLMVASLVCLMLLGCQSRSAEPVVLSVLYNGREDVPYQEDWLIVQQYLEQKNIALDVRVGDDADFERVVIQTLESGVMPDVILKVWPSTVEGYAASGLLLPFSDYQEQMPHFGAYIEKHNLQAELDKLRLDNGKFYILPGYQRKIQVQQWIYRKDLFEKHELGTPKTYEEMFAALVRLKELYPETTPLTATWGGAHLLAMMGAGYDIPAGWNGTRAYDAVEDRWEFSPATDNYRELLRFLNRCYEAGILDPEMFEQSPEEFIQKIQDGRALVTVTWITSGFDSWNAELRGNGYPEGEWAALPVPESTVGIRALPAVDPFRKGLVVPAQIANEPYFEDLLDFLDWAVYSEEGMTLTTWGVEGVTFEQTTDGKAFLPEIQTPIDTVGTGYITKEYGLDTLLDLNENTEFEDYKKPPEIVAFLEASLQAKETATLNPELRLDTSALDAIQIVDEQVNPYVTEATVLLITGELDVEQDWEGYVDEFEARGCRTLEEIWNTTWQAQQR